MIPDIEYFILDYNPEHHERGVRMLERTVEKLYANRNPNLRSRTWMINQGGNPDHRQFHFGLAEKYKYELIDLDDNVGISRGVNTAARLCRAPVMCLVTSDALMTKGCDEDALEKLQRDDIIQVGPLASSSDIAAQRIETPGYEFGDDEVELDVWDGNMVCCLSAELNIRYYDMKQFEQIGYLDERWKAAFENRDHALRGFLSGLYSVVSYGSFCWHYGHGTHITGAIKTAYKGYIDSADRCGASPELIMLWRKKWGDIDRRIDYCQPIDFHKGPPKDLVERHKDKLYLPFVQDVGY